MLAQNTGRLSSAPTRLPKVLVHEPNYQSIFLKKKMAMQSEWKSKIKGAGGLLHPKMKKDTSCLVLSGVLDERDAETRKARRMRILIVREDYLTDCVERQRKLSFDTYKVEATRDASGMVTVKVKG